jgi:flagellin
MARINTNVPSLVAQSHLNRANDDLAVRLERLSTGLRINRGADDPAGLITSERLRSEIRGIDQAITNSQRASSVIAVAEGALIEVSDLLNSIKGLVVEAANTGGVSDEEIAANQLQVDSAIESITRIANATNFGGLKLLNGDLEYVLSGVDSTELTKATVHAASFGDNSTVPVSVEVLGSAQHAQLYMQGDADIASGGAIVSSFTMELAGTEGVTSLSFVSGTMMSSIVAAINQLAGATGVSAVLANGADQASGLVLLSREHGSDAFVSVDTLGSGGEDLAFYAADGWSTANGAAVDVTTDVTRDIGQDVSAIVNGQLATGKGLDISLDAPTLALSLSLESTFAATISGTASEFTVTGGGSVFQLGPEVSHNQQESLGLQSVTATHLGGTLINGNLVFLNDLQSGGAFDLDSGSLSNASSILEEAIDEIAVLRGRLGSFERNTLQTNVRSMQAALENVTASESAIRDTDFAVETSNLSRAQILTQAGTSVLAIANTNAQTVLQLLG